MANIFTYESQDIDLKECIKLRTNCQQLDTVVLQFNVYNYDSPVDLTNFNVELVGVKPDGTLYRQADGITKSNNQLTVSCDSQLTASIGKVKTELRIWDNSGNQKSSYFILLSVSGLVSDDDRVISQNYIDVLERFDTDVNTALKLSIVFKEDINEANSLEESFRTSIDTANSLETAFNQAISDANTNKIALDNSNTNALTTKSELDALNINANNTINVANTVKTNLDLDKADVNSLNDTLITTIANANSKLQDFKNYDTTSLVPLSNTMLNEMYCNKELLTINHNLNGYPIVKLTYTEYGAGIGGAGDFPAGANSNCDLMQNKTVYIDRNTLTIYVPEDYYIENESINKINDYRYVITFTNSTKSILIELMEGNISEQLKEKANNIDSNRTTNAKDVTGAINELNNNFNIIEPQISQISNPNLLINGDFQIWQRGTSFTDGTPCYSTDRWYKGYTGLFTKTNGKCVFTSMGSGNSSLDQYIENPSKFAGKTLTASILAILSLPNSASLKVNRNVGGVVTTLGTINISSGIKTSLSVVIPSDVVDTDKLSVCIQFNGSSTLNQTITFNNNSGYVKLELGTIATPFNSKSYAEELALCQRYYFKNRWKTLRSAVVGSTTLRTCEYNFPVQMRVAPTITCLVTQPVNEICTCDCTTNIISPTIGQISSTTIGIVNNTMCDFQFNHTLGVKDFIVEILDYAYQFDAEIY